MLKQQGRQLQLSTPLGEDVLLLTAFQGREEIAKLFSLQLEMISDDSGLQAADIVGQQILIKMNLPDGNSRYFSGHVSWFSAGDEDDEGRRNYRAELVPWLWFLTRTSNCRIFQNKTAVEIIESVFQSLGFSDYEVGKVKGDHPTREYCVQYRETDFNFVSRLLEQDGIFYFFRHTAGKHTLVLADQSSGYEECAQASADFPRHLGPYRGESILTGWDHRYEFISGRVAQKDYSFENPRSNLLTNEKSVIAIPNMDKFELYDYPGGYQNANEGKSLARVRIESEEARHNIIEGTSHCGAFTPGTKFTVNRHRSRSEEGKAFVIAAVNHSAIEPMAYETSAPVAFDYHNSFRCFPDSVTFRPPLTTPKPRIQGTQTAVVVGPEGEEVHTDQYGRVKVQFHWDREGKMDENSSCWMRVATLWAGNRRGVIYIPMIGDEVLIDFLEGDPDRPLVIGSLYNGDMMPPFELPANKRICGEKGDTGSNYIKTNNLKGHEKIEIHAEKDYNTKVRADAKYEVDGQRFDRVGSVYHIHTKKLWVVGEDEIMLTVQGNTIRIHPGGIDIDGNVINSRAAGNNTVLGALVKLNC